MLICISEVMGRTSSHASIQAPVMERERPLGVPPTSSATTRMCMQMKEIVSGVTVQDVLDPNLFLSGKITTQSTFGTSTRKTSAVAEERYFQGIRIDRSTNAPRTQGWLSELSPQNIGGVLKLCFVVGMFFVQISVRGSRRIRREVHRRVRLLPEHGSRIRIVITFLSELHDLQRHILVC